MHVHAWACMCMHMHACACIILRLHACTRMRVHITAHMRACECVFQDAVAKRYTKAWKRMEINGNVWICTDKHGHTWTQWVTLRLQSSLKRMHDEREQERLGFNARIADLLSKQIQSRFSGDSRPQKKTKFQASEDGCISAFSLKSSASTRADQNEWDDVQKEMAMKLKEAVPFQAPPLPRDEAGNVIHGQHAGWYQTSNRQPKGASAKDQGWVRDRQITRRLALHNMGMNRWVKGFLDDELCWFQELQTWIGHGGVKDINAALRLKLHAEWARLAAECNSATAGDGKPVVTQGVWGDRAYLLHLVPIPDEGNVENAFAIVQDYLCRFSSAYCKLAGLPLPPPGMQKDLH